MIKFSLSCDKDHDFEAWFASNDDFITQQLNSLVSCPFCSSSKVEKALMSPAIGKSSNSLLSDFSNDFSTDNSSEAMALPDGKRRKILKKMRELRQELLADAKDVGDKFPEEARKIHYGESKEQGIYGKANVEEVEELWEEGIPVSSLPSLPDDAN